MMTVAPPSFVRPPVPLRTPPSVRMPLPVADTVRPPVEAAIGMEITGLTPCTFAKMSVPDDDNCSALPRSVKEAWFVSVMLSKIVFAVKLLVFVVWMAPLNTRPFVATGAVSPIQLEPVSQLPPTPPPSHVTSVWAEAGTAARATSATATAWRVFSIVAPKEKMAEPARDDGLVNVPAAHRRRHHAESADPRWKIERPSVLRHRPKR